MMERQRVRWKGGLHGEIQRRRETESLIRKVWRMLIEGKRRSEGQRVGWRKWTSDEATEKEKHELNEKASRSIRGKYDGRRNSVFIFCQFISMSQHISVYANLSISDFLFVYHSFFLSRIKWTLTGATKMKIIRNGNRVTWKSEVETRRQNKIRRIRKCAVMRLTVGGVAKNTRNKRKQKEKEILSNKRKPLVNDLNSWLLGDHGRGKLSLTASSCWRLLVPHIASSSRPPLAVEV